MLVGSLKCWELSVDSIVAPDILPPARSQLLDRSIRSNGLAEKLKNRCSCCLLGLGLVSLSQIQNPPPKSMILLVGPPGSGKSTFCYKTVVSNLAANRPVIFVATEHAPSDLMGFLRETGLGEMASERLSFVDAFHGTIGLSAKDSHLDTINSSCGDLTSIEVAISKLQNKIQEKGILLVFDSLTSPYLLNGKEMIKFLRFSLAKFAAEGNAVLMCIDEGCGEEEDLGAMMSIANGIIKMRLEGGIKFLSIVKHPLVKPVTITVPISGVTSVSPLTIDSFESLNETLDWIVRRLGYLEMILTESQKYPEVVGFLQSLRIGTAVYGEPLKTLSRLVSAKRVAEPAYNQDEISRIILNAIALKGKQNITQLTREVRSQRGKASRTTVRKRVKRLLQSKALIKEGSYYRLPEQFG
jgi:KaiC/GvpD/RAD55 family RecA-like ATPase